VDEPTHHLLTLGLTLRVHHDVERQRHMAHLAGRLGYSSVWLPIGTTSPMPDVDVVDRLSSAAYPARVGLVVAGGHAELPLVASIPGVLLEIHHADRERALGAVGARGWRDRVHVAALAGAMGATLDSAGVVLSGALPGLFETLALCVTARVDAGRTPVDLPITLDMTASIGRTTAEAQARVARDADLCGTRDPKVSGLFGTLEQAQQQALSLRRAGADALRVTLADEQDIADLLAQFRAVVTGPTAVLHARAGRA
jgi:hypothetical protein